jgi:hypothetical protein
LRGRMAFSNPKKKKKKTEEEIKSRQSIPIQSSRHKTPLRVMKNTVSGIRN